ncbi:MAG: hypothetical protein Kow0068_14210 [Marinilabiliales bacterium]
MNDSHELCIAEFLEILPDSACLLDNKANIIHINKSFSKKSGYLFENIINSHISVVLPDFNNENFSILKKRGLIKNLEKQIKKKNSTKTWVEINARKVKYNNKTCYLFLLHDITERKKSELVVKESEQYYRKLFLEFPAGYISLNKNLVFVDINPVITNILGYTKSELIDKNIRNFITKDSYGNLVKYLEQSKKIDFNGILTIKAHNSLGERKILDINASASFYIDGSFNCYHIIVNDITNLIIEKEKAEKYYKALINSYTPIAIFDSNHNFEFVNSAFSKLTGYTNNELVGEHVSKLWTDNNTGMDIIKTIEKGKTWEGEVCNKKKDGTNYWELLAVIPVNNDSKKSKNFIAISKDITDIKISEQESKIEKEKAIKSNKQKSIFISNISHDIRTPLNAITGFTDLLYNPEITEEKKKYFLDIIKNSCNQLNTLINDIIDVSKIEANKLKIYNENFQPWTLMLELLSIYNNRLSQLDKNLELVIDVSEKDKNIEIYADQNRIRQILINLLDNSFKFTEKGSIKFGYSVIKNQKIKFFVEDTGIGMAKSVQKAVFESFVQAHEKIGKKHGGSGLGLAICKRLVELMNGNIELVSKVNVGTKIVFTLPINNGNELKTKNGILPVKEKICSVIKNKKILIIEDDNVSYELIKAVFEEYEPDISWIKDGDTALKMIEKTKPDLVLLDINLPGKDGYTIIESIKEMDADTPVIVQTAYAMNDEIYKIRSYNIDNILIKPISPDILLNTVINCLNN